MLLMAASKDKAILFARAKTGRDVHQWPVAVFNDEPKARMYASMLKLAYRSGDDAIIKAMDPGAVRGEDGNPVADTAWSVVTVAYEPKPELDDTPAAT
jgi:hypothetical protein